MSFTISKKETVMDDLFLLSDRQVTRIPPFFPLSHGVPLVDDLWVVSGIIYVIRNGSRWKDAPTGYAPHRTLYNCFICWSVMGVFDRVLSGLAREGPKPERVIIDAMNMTAHRTAVSLLKRADVPRGIGRTKGWLNSKRHTVCD